MTGEMTMTLPIAAFYAEPRFRRSSPKFAQLNAAREWTPKTPGASLAFALDYYRVEIFANEKDRRLACGATAHEDVCYFPASRQTLLRAGTTLADVSCGYSIDRAGFEETVTPIFDSALSRLIRDVARVPKNQTGSIASTVISIARARYIVSVTGAGDWLKFDVKWISLFEPNDTDLMERTAQYLERRLLLKLSPALSDAKCN